MLIFPCNATNLKCSIKTRNNKKIMFVKLLKVQRFDSLKVQGSIQDYCCDSQPVANIARLNMILLDYSSHLSLGWN